MTKIINNKNHLYVFVKGRKGKGAYEVTDKEYKLKYKGEIESEEKLPPSTMDLRAIEKSLEYIKECRGKNGVPAEPVVSIFTTYENNYHVASGLKKPKKPERIRFTQALEKLRGEFSRPGNKLLDEIKCYWIPEGFENCIKDVNELLDKSKTKRD